MKSDELKSHLYNFKIKLLSAFEKQSRNEPVWAGSIQYQSVSFASADEFRAEHQQPSISLETRVLNPEKVQSQPLTAYVICMLLAVFFIGWSIKDRAALLVKEARARDALIVQGLTASELLQGRHSFLGTANAPYTLVEFGDYECPPCRSYQAKITALLQQHEGHLRLDFRHFPLSTIHPYAMQASVTAEAARDSGKFWPVHEALFASSLEDEAIREILKQSGVTLGKDDPFQIRVSEDLALAKRLGVDRTPSFFLCLPDKRVVRLRSLGDCEEIITSGYGR